MMTTNEEEFNPIEQESQPADAAEDAAEEIQAAPTPAAEHEALTDSSSPAVEIDEAAESPAPADESEDEAELSAPADESEDEAESPAPVDESKDEDGSRELVEDIRDARATAATALKAESTEDDDRAWYVIHCYSGYENKVRYNLEQRIESMGMKDMIFDVVIPTQEEIEVREGKRRSIERHVFPGYILVNLILTDESWFVVRNTPGVTGFVGMGNDPTPLRPEEVSQILKRMEADAPHMKVTFRSGERVRIIDGPFNDFRGTVADIDMDRAKVTVMVNFFGRETPVELDFLQVEKA